MPDDKLTPADPNDLADTIAFSLRFEGRRRVHEANEYMAAIAADRIVRHLERSGFVVLKRPPASAQTLSRAATPVELGEGVKPVQS